MNKIIYPLLLLNLSCGLQNDCNIESKLYPQHLNQYIPEGAKNELIKRDYLNYVLINANNINFSESLIYTNSGYVAGAANYEGCYCNVGIALKDNFGRDRKDIEIANTLVHESAHCESQSMDELYPEQKEKEFLGAKINNE